MLRKILCTGAVLFVVLHTQNTQAVDFSANIGFASEYIYRGIPQKSSSASGGLDLEAGGFYLGTWGADVGDGIEIDYYGGYGFGVGDFYFTVGGTLYTYTGDFDDTYTEINLGTGWKFLSFDAAIGEYDNFTGPTLSYQFYSLTGSYHNFYGKVDTFQDDFEGSYYEAGYSNTLSVKETDLFDYAFAVVYSDSSLLGGESDTNLTLTLTKVFSF
jgi:uncharacterized protein (TIGR02001 family)